MPKEIPTWKKQLLEREPDEDRPSLDPEALIPHKEKIKALEKELAALDNFLNQHFDAKTKPQRADFVKTFKELYVSLPPPIIDPVSAALSDDILERILVLLANRLQRPPVVMGKISNELQNKGKDEPLEQVLEYVKTLHLGIIENKKKILWQLAEHVGIKKSAAIFQEQDLIKERAFPEYLASPEHSASLEPGWKQRFESGDPEAAEIVRLEFNIWYEKNKVKFLMNHQKIRDEVEELSKKLHKKEVYKIIEKHLLTNPKEIFELLKNQTRISSG